MDDIRRTGVCRKHKGHLNVRLLNLQRRELVVEMAKVALINVVVNNGAAELGIFKESRGGARANFKARGLVIAAKVIK